MNNTKKADKKIRWDRIIKSRVIYFVLLLMVMSCDKSNVNMVKEAAKEDQEISQIDNEPIIKLQDAEFYHGNVLDNIRDNLAENHGPAIVKALNDDFSSQQNIQVVTPISVQKLNSLVQRKENAPEIGSTHLRVTEPDGESEDFVLSLRQYYYDPAEAAQ